MKAVKEYLSFFVMLLLLLYGIRFLAFQNGMYREVYTQLSRLTEHSSIAVETGE